MKKKRNTRRKRKLWRARLARFIAAEFWKVVADFADAIKAGRVDLGGPKVKWDETSAKAVTTPEGLILSGRLAGAFGVPVDIVRGTFMGLVSAGDLP